MVQAYITRALARGRAPLSSRSEVPLLTAVVCYPQILAKSQKLRPPLNDYFHYSYNFDQLLTEENIVFDSDVYVRFLHNGYFSGATIVLDEVRVVVATQGDFDADGDVDGVDLGIWETGFGTQTNASIGDGDADGDQDVNGYDFLEPAFCS